MLRGKDIVCLGLAEWGNPYKTNQHHIISRLSLNNRVLFIESLGLRRPAFQKNDLIRVIRRIVKFGVRRINKNLYVYSPLVLPYHSQRSIRLANHTILLITLKRILKRLGFQDHILLTYSPNGGDLIGRLCERLSIYYCVDKLSSNPRIPKDAVEEMERDLLRKVDIVLASSRPLFEDIRVFNPNTYYIPNGVDPIFFNKKGKIPQDLTRIPRPIIGFIGAISSYKLDFGLIREIAISHPGWSVVLIGSFGEGEKPPDRSPFKGVSNIYLLGRRDPSLLPSYLEGFDVCILPSRMNDYTKNMFPIKFFEYMASGKPLVLIDLPSLREYREYFYPATNKDEFIKAIEIALREEGRLAHRRIELAKWNTWDDRVHEISRIIDERLMDEGK